MTKRNLLPNKVDINLNVLGTTMLDRIRGHVDSTNVVTEDNNGRRQRVMELPKELTDPTTLSNNMSNRAILRLGTGARHSSLTFGQPGDKVVADDDEVARQGFALVRAAGKSASQYAMSRWSK